MDSHTWSENCVLCGGRCKLGKGAKLVVPEHRIPKADSEETVLFGPSVGADDDGPESDEPVTEPEAPAKPKRDDHQHSHKGKHKR